jgi:hypothetical protein
LFERHQRRHPVERFGHARNLVEIDVTQLVDQRCDLRGELRRHVRDARLHDRELLLEGGVLDPLIETATLERVVHLARAVRRQHDERRRRRADGAEFGDRHLELGQQLQQIALDLFVRAIDLVDQEDGRPRARGIDRLQQGTLEQEAFGVELCLGGAQRAGGFEDAKLEELPRIVPLIRGLTEVEPFVALQSDQIGPECCGDGRCERGLADAGFPFEEQRTLQPQGQEHRDGEPLVCHIVLRRELLLQVCDRVHDYRLSTGSRGCLTELSADSRRAPP